MHRADHISVPPRGALANRQARPLNGLEVRQAIENHLMAFASKKLDEVGLLSDQIIKLLDDLKKDADAEFLKRTSLQKVNITYPRVGWNLKIRLEEYESNPPMEIENLFLSAEVELDLQQNVRLHIPIGQSGIGKVIKSWEEEKLNNPVPDRDRQAFGLRVEAKFLKPDGTSGTVDITELRRERRAARSVDVGSGAVDRISTILPADKRREDGTLEITTREVLAAAGQAGEVIVLPDQLPEITLDDLVATPPVPPPLEPPATPLPPPGGMSRVSRPKAKLVN